MSRLIKRTYKDAPDQPEFLDLVAAVRHLVRNGYFKTTKGATDALLSGIPVQASFACYELNPEPET